MTKRTAKGLRRTRPLTGATAVALTLVLTLALAGCVRHSGTTGERDFALPRDGYTMRAALRYSPEDWPETLTADVYAPVARGRHPAVLVVHGGGWTRRSPEDTAFIAERLAEAGFVAFNISYRFAPEHRFPAQIHDLQLALRWIRANSERFSIDPDRVGGFGYSAGAHLLALVALIDAGDPLDSPWGGEAARLGAVVAGGTPTDLQRWPDSPLVNDLLGQPKDAAPALWAAASPITHVEEDEPPFFLYHGGLDRLVEPRQAKDLAEVLRARGNDAELFLVPYHGHLSLFALDRSAVREGIRFLTEKLSPGGASGEG